MIHFEEIILPNGLKILVHEDATTPLAAVNILYKVGARDEDPNRTGFAHLFEHFMFEGSVNIPDFDTQLQLAGGENNAFTSNDITNYYDILPAVNLETAFWLESDRMLSLDFNLESLRNSEACGLRRIQRTLYQSALRRCLAQAFGAGLQGPPIHVAHYWQRPLACGECRHG